VGSAIRQLVLLPGMDGTGKLFDEFIEALPREFEIRTVRFSPDAIHSYSELFQIVQSAIPESDPFVLLAESFSTPLAIQCAAANPANLRGVILCAGFASSPLRGWKRWAFRLLAPYLFRMTIPGFAIRQFLVGRGAPPELAAAVRKATSQVQPRVLRNRLRLIADCDAQPDLARVNVPVLYLRATGDRMVSVRCGEEIQRVNPRTKMEAIAGPHLLLQREPRECADAVVRFVMQLE
jgi:pimeloyl-[acyl-carrier protein] methyl ester esterase